MSKIIAKWCNDDICPKWLTNELMNLGGIEMGYIETETGSYHTIICNKETDDNLVLRNLCKEFETEQALDFVKRFEDEKSGYKNLSSRVGWDIEQKLVYKGMYFTQCQWNLFQQLKEFIDNPCIHLRPIGDNKPLKSGLWVDYGTYTITQIHHHIYDKDEQYVREIGITLKTRISEFLYDKNNNVCSYPQIFKFDYYCGDNYFVVIPHTILDIVDTKCVTEFIFENLYTKGLLVKTYQGATKIAKKLHEYGNFLLKKNNHLSHTVYDDRWKLGVLISGHVEFDEHGNTFINRIYLNNRK